MGYTDKNTKIVTYLKRTWTKSIYMLVEFETTTEIAACVLHDLTAKIIRTPPVYRFVLQVQNNLKKYHS